MDSSDITRHASQADIIFVSWSSCLSMRHVYPSYLKHVPHVTLKMSTDLSVWNHLLKKNKINSRCPMLMSKCGPTTCLSTCLSVFNPLLKTRICSSLISLCHIWIQRQQLLNVWSAIVPLFRWAPHNWSEASRSTTFSWQPLGPLLKVKLLEGYI